MINLTFINIIPLTHVTNSKTHIYNTTTKQMGYPPGNEMAESLTITDSEKGPIKTQRFHLWPSNTTHLGFHIQTTVEMKYKFQRSIQYNDKQLNMHESKPKWFKLNIIYRLYLYFSFMHIHKHMVLTTYLNSKPIQFHIHQHIKIIETK